MTYVFIFYVLTLVVFGDIINEQSDESYYTTPAVASVSLSVCFVVHAVEGKPLELSTPKLLEIVSMAGLWQSAYIYLRVRVRDGNEDGDIVVSASGYDCTFFQLLYCVLLYGMIDNPGDSGLWRLRSRSLKSDDFSTQ